MLKTALQAMRLAIAGYIVPFIFIYKPTMVLIGDPLEILLALMDAILAVAALAVATEGYFRHPLGWPERLLLVIACIAFFVPGWMSRIVGLLFLASPFVYYFLARGISERKGNS